MDVTEDIQKDVARRIREGFGGFENNVERIVDYLQDSYPDTDIAPLVRAALAPAWAKAIEDQVSWPELTDCDRLDRAFAALERQGVVARQHFTCCWNCGNVEIRAEVEDAGKKMHVAGYIYYHNQITKRAAACGEMYFAHGCANGTEDGWRKVGWTAVEAMRKEGLAPLWNGEPRTCIELKGLDWRRRLSAAG